MSHRIAASATLALALLGVTPASSQQAVPPPHRLRVGDSLRIIVTPQVAYNREVKVHSDGRIYYPVVGEVYAVGKTIQELRKIIQDGLNQELRGHQVTVEPLQLVDGPGPGPAPDPAPLGRVAVVGAVGQPGSVALPEEPLLAAVLAKVGGLSPSADLARVIVSRDDLTQVTLDPRSELGRAFRLRGGDVVVVPGSAAEMRLGSVVGFEPMEVDAVRPAAAAAADALKTGGLGSAGLDAALFQLVPARALAYRSAASAFVLVPDAALLRQKSVPDDWQLLPVGLVLTRALTVAGDSPAALAQSAKFSLPGGPQDLAAFFLVARRSPEGGRLEVYGAGKDPLLHAPLTATPAGQDLPLAFRNMLRSETTAEFRLPGRVTAALRLLAQPASGP